MTGLPSYRVELWTSFELDRARGRHARPGVWVVVGSDAPGSPVGGPDRAGVWANSFELKVDAEYACSVRNRVELDLDLFEVVELIRSAVDDEGACPAEHRRVVEKHRREWPTLWRALDLLLGRGVV